MNSSCRSSSKHSGDCLETLVSYVFFSAHLLATLTMPSTWCQRYILSLSPPQQSGHKDTCSSVGQKLVWARWSSVQSYQVVRLRGKRGRKWVWWRIREPMRWRLWWPWWHCLDAEYELCVEEACRDHLCCHFLLCCVVVHSLEGMRNQQTLLKSL